MRGSWLLAGLVLSACYSIPPYEGDPTLNDADQDGVPDSEDLCPHISSPSGHADDDSDGVGNDCDMNPGVRDEKFFTSFVGGSTGTLVRKGSITPEDGQLQIGVVSSALENSLMLMKTYSRIQVDARFGITEQTPNSIVALSLGRYSDSDFTAAAFCTLTPAGGLARLGAEYKYTGMPTPVTETTGPVANLAFTPMNGRLHAELVANRLTCMADQLENPGDTDEDPPISVGLNISPDAEPGSAGVVVVSAAASLEYLFITGVP